MSKNTDIEEKAPAGAADASAGRMTNEQFDALVKLMRGGPETSANRAARLILVEGKSPPAAGLETGATRGVVHNTAKRYSDADAMIRRAYKVPPEA